MVMRVRCAVVPLMLMWCPPGCPLGMKVHVIVDVRSSPTHPLGDTIETFIRREDAERAPIAPHHRMG